HVRRRGGSGGPELIRELRGRSRVNVSHKHRGTLIGQATACRRTDPVGSTGNQRAHTIEPPHHVSSAPSVLDRSSVRRWVTSSIHSRGRSDGYGRVATDRTFRSSSSSGSSFVPPPEWWYTATV